MIPGNIIMMAISTPGFAANNGYAIRNGILYAPNGDSTPIPSDWIVSSGTDPNNAGATAIQSTMAQATVSVPTTANPPVVQTTGVGLPVPLLIDPGYGAAKPNPTLVTGPTGIMTPAPIAVNTDSTAVIGANGAGPSLAAPTDYTNYIYLGIAAVVLFMVMKK